MYEGMPTHVYGPDGYPEPPTAEQLHAMAEAGELTQPQLVEMLADLEAWKMGDAETRAALMEKYGGDHQSDPYYDPYFDQVTYESTLAAQDAADAAASVANGIATKTQLTSIQTGQFHYTATGAFTQTRLGGSQANLAGSMTAILNIDFGSRTIGGGGSQLSVNTTGAGGNINASMAIAAQSFSAGSGDLATYSQTSGSLTGSFEIKNSDGIIGATARVGATYDSGTDQGTGSIDNIARSSGLQ